MNVSGAFGSVHPVQVDGFEELDIDEELLTAADRARINQRTILGLTWAAKHTSTATTSLAVAFKVYEPCASSAAANPFIAACSGVAQWTNLRCLELSPRPLRDGRTDPALMDFLDWLLEQVPKLEAFLQIRTRHLPARHITFQHMRCLAMTSHGCQSYFMVAKQLPALETLCVSARCDTGLEVIDMSGCTRLRQLVLSDFVAQQLIWDATGSGPCPLTFELQNPMEDFARGSLEPLSNQAALAQQAIISCDNPNSPGLQWCVRMFGAFPLARVLALRWPVCYDELGWPDEDAFDEDAAHLFSWCMPDDRQPLSNLKSIIITACSMQGTFPHASQLPNLRELVIKASGRLEMAFQSPIGTISQLGSFHVFGQPLIPNGWDMIRLMTASRALEERGLVLGAASRQRHGPRGRPASCIYLRPVGDRDLSIQELCTKVKQLIECRCGACLDCLRRAGCMEG